LCHGGTRLSRVLWRLWNYLLPLVATLNSDARRLLNSLNPLRRSFTLRRLHSLNLFVVRLGCYGSLLRSRLPSGFLSNVAMAKNGRLA